MEKSVLDMFTLQNKQSASDQTKRIGLAVQKKETSKKLDDLKE